MKPGRPNLYTKDSVIDAALTLARSVGYLHMTCEAIARRVGCSRGEVSHLLGTMTQLRRTVVRHAVKRRDLPVIAQALVAKDPHVQGVDEDLKTAALQSVL